MFSKVSSSPHLMSWTISCATSQCQLYSWRASQVENSPRKNGSPYSLSSPAYTVSRTWEVMSVRPAFASIILFDNCLPRPLDLIEIPSRQPCNVLRLGAPVLTDPVESETAFMLVFPLVSHSRNDR